MIWASTLQFISYIRFTTGCAALFAFGALCEGATSTFIDGTIEIKQEAVLGRFTSGDSLAVFVLFLFLSSSFYFAKKGIVDQYKTKRAAFRCTLAAISTACFGLTISASMETGALNEIWARIVCIYTPSLLFFICVLNSRFPHKYRNGFDLKVFFPTFLVCCSSISMGIVTQYNMEGAHIGDRMIFGVDTNMKFCWIVGASQLLNLSLMLYPENPERRRYIHISVPIFVIFFSFAFNVWLDGTEGKYGIAIYAAIYLLGLSQAILHMGRMISRGGDINQEANKFYFPAINWSMAVIPFGSLLMPVLFKELSYPPILLYSFVSFLVWTLTSYSNKSNSTFCIVASHFMAASCITCLLLSAFNIGPATQIFSKPIEIGDDYWLASVIGTLSSLGISAALIRLAKDSIGVQLHILYKNIDNLKIYYGVAGPLMLGFSFTFVICVFNAAFWLAVVTYFPYDPSQKIFLQQRMTISCVGAILICMMTLVILLIRSTTLKLTINEASDLNKEIFKY